jgi:hypothetical protein
MTKETTAGTTKLALTMTYSAFSLQHEEHILFARKWLPDRRIAPKATAVSDLLVVTRKRDLCATRLALHWEDNNVAE